MNGTSFRYVTEEIPPVRGRIKVSPEDFLVEEVPLYNVSGSGDHTFFMVEKRGMTTFEVAKRVASLFGRREEEIGFAGLKDAHAVTRQVLSVEGVEPSVVLRMSLPGVRVLWAERHQNKLGVGHLRGNRFQIRIRGVQRSDLTSCRKVVEKLRAVGVPNYFGRQRFGSRALSHKLGAALVRGDYRGFMDGLMGGEEDGGRSLMAQARRHYRAGRLQDALDLVPRHRDVEKRCLKALVSGGGFGPELARAIPKRLRGFFVCAYQSYLFNRFLCARLDRMNVVEEGDVAYLHRNGAAFVVEDASREQPRVDRFEISVSGPIYGYQMLEAEGGPGLVERDLLSGEGIRLRDFRTECALRQRGGRRPLRFPIEVGDVRLWDKDLILQFFLPRGCYATTVLEEVLKPGRVEPWLPELG